jgi:predicted acetyltransferase
METFAHDAEDLPAHIELIPASAAQKSTVANLLELYAHDFSEFRPAELDDDGRFGYKSLPLYWSDPGRCPFLIKVDGWLAGVALVKSGSEVSDSENVWDLAEFFIVRAHRRQGIGMKIAHELWRRFPGRWEVRVMPSNGAALKFWHVAIATFSRGSVRPLSIEKNGVPWWFFSFESRQ